MTYEELEKVVRIVLTHDQMFDTNKTALTEDHVFGHYVMELVPKTNLLPRSHAHREQTIRAVTASVANILGL